MYTIKKELKPESKPLNIISNNVMNSKHFFIMNA